MSIITNNVPRDIIDASQLTIKERTAFDYINWPAIELGEDSASFFRYKGQLYDLGEFEEIDRQHTGQELAAWHGIQTDSFFSATLVRYVDEFERVVIARIYS